MPIIRKLVQNQGRTSKPQILTLLQEGNKVYSTWGQEGGAMQSTCQTFEGVNIGKANEKSPDQVAIDWQERQVLLKTRQGYVEEGVAGSQEEAASEMNFNHLPANLRWFKPQNSMNAHCLKLIEKRKAIVLRKRDGMMHSLLIDEEGNPRLHSLNVLTSHKDEEGIPWLNRYPQIEKAVRALNLPPRTVLLGEICVTYTHKKKGTHVADDFNYVGSIVKSLTPLALQKQKERSSLAFCVWDIGFYDGRCYLQEIPAKERFAFLERILQGLNKSHRMYLTMPEWIELTPDGFTVHYFDEVVRTAYRVKEKPQPEGAELLKFAKDNGWEGFVVIDPDSTYGDRAFNFHGKAERPKEVCKYKPVLEADFILRFDPDNGIGEWGKGKKTGGVGAFFAYLWDDKKEEEVPVCKVGGGLTDEQVKKYANPDLYPLVGQVQFSEWTDKGAMRQPVFLRIRDDKKPDECTIDQRPSVEEDE